MYEKLRHGNILKEAVELVEGKIAAIQQRIDQVAETNALRVLNAFRDHQVSDFHLTPSTGYGYDDAGRDNLDQIYADVFGAEAGIVRPQIMSGTHAISLALFGVLRPGDELLYITGKPYDTLHDVIGVRGQGHGSLKEFQITFNAVNLLEDGSPDFDQIGTALNDRTKVVAIQRSKGYEDRPSFPISKIKEITQFVKNIKEDIIVFVDNCYGEFVEDLEPGHVGVDLMAGSLIKNPGGGIVKTGGYIVGNRPLVDQCAHRLTAPGVGAEIGASLYSLAEMYQGFFLAPHIVSQALKGAVFTSALLAYFGLSTNPSWNDTRTDLVQTVQFRNEEEMIAFCQAIQYASPVNAHVTPYPSAMPGYDDNVIMAGGTFIQGSSIELSADGPIRPPYNVYVQGGLTYSHVKIALIQAIDHLLEKGFLTE